MDKMCHGRNAMNTNDAVIMSMDKILLIVALVIPLGISLTKVCQKMFTIVDDPELSQE